MDSIRTAARTALRWLGRCRVPRHLADVLSVAEEVPARDVGIPQREVDEIWRSVERS